MGQSGMNGIDGVNLITTLKQIEIFDVRKLYKQKWVEVQEVHLCSKIVGASWISAEILLPKNHRIKIKEVIDIRVPALMDM